MATRTFAKTTRYMTDDQLWALTPAQLIDRHRAEKDQRQIVRMNLMMDAMIWRSEEIACFFGAEWPSIHDQQVSGAETAEEYREWVARRLAAMRAAGEGSAE